MHRFQFCFIHEVFVGGGIDSVQMLYVEHVCTRIKPTSPTTSSVGSIWGRNVTSFFRFHSLPDQFSRWLLLSVAGLQSGLCCFCKRFSSSQLGKIPKLANTFEV